MGCFQSIKEALRGFSVADVAQLQTQGVLPIPRRGLRWFQQIWRQHSHYWGYFQSLRESLRGFSTLHWSVRLAMLPSNPSERLYAVSAQASQLDGAQTDDFQSLREALRGFSACTTGASMLS